MVVDDALAGCHDGGHCQWLVVSVDKGTHQVNDKCHHHHHTLAAQW